MEKLKSILGYTFHFGEEGTISVLSILFVCITFLGTSIVLRIIRTGVTKNISFENKARFISIFSYFKYFVFVIVFLVALNNSGINVTGILAGAAALLIGVGLALQTLFQDIFSGIFILVDQSLNVNDIIEIEGKVGRVTKINLRTTRAVTIENKVLVIPNHLFLTNTLYNWTQNEKITRESVAVGVAYGSDVQLVKQLLLKATSAIPGVLKNPEPIVFFSEFGDSSLNFKLVFTIEDSFSSALPKSDLHFEIDRLFRENNISIPFPQRDVHLYATEK